MVENGEQVLEFSNLPPPPTTPELPSALAPGGDHSDLLEDDDDLSRGAIGDALGGLPADAEGLDLGDLRATLGGAASGLAEQLQSITEEMNKIRSELYGDQGIGGIAKELEKLKTGSLGGLLDNDALNGVLGGLEGLGGGRPGDVGASASANSGHGSASRSCGFAGGEPESRPRAGAGSARAAGTNPSLTEARRRRDETSRDAELAALQRKVLEQKRGKKQAQSQVSIWEKLMLLFLILVCLYVCSPFFRTSVKRAISLIVFGEDLEIDDETFDE